jgi:Putative redox-active protein (C_GCAxxG_C_C)
LRVLDNAFGHPLKLEEHAVMPLAGGIMQHGYQCGMIWGATLAAGAEGYRRFGATPQAEARAVIAARGIVEAFRDRNAHINCLEITEIDRTSSGMQMFMYFLVKGGTIGCLRRAAKYAPAALEEIETAFSEPDIEAVSPPVSCAALLARQMGMSDMHAVMAAGLAGGIGLCGGACGALGAALWIIGVKTPGESGGKVDFKSPRAEAAIERFMECTDYEFECSNIVGRKFEGVRDHAEYLRNGGCSELIEALAAV